MAGILVSPPDFIVTALDFVTLYLAWSPPFTLNVTGNSQSSILAYSILVKNGSGEVITINSTVNEYHYKVSEDNECQLETYEVCVAGINGVGIGVYSQPVMFSVGCKYIGLCIFWESYNCFGFLYHSCNTLWSQLISKHHKLVLLQSFLL